MSEILCDGNNRHLNKKGTIELVTVTPKTGRNVIDKYFLIENAIRTEL